MQLFVTILIPLLAGFWVFIDAKDKGRTDGKAFLWGLGTFLALIIFLPLWLFMRKKEGQTKRSRRYCSHCGRPLQEITGASFCPYCGHGQGESDVYDLPSETGKSEDEEKK